MTDIADPDYAALDRFMSTVYWADDDIDLNDALIDAVDTWTATVSAEHNNSEPFTNQTHNDALAATLHELLTATATLTDSVRPGLTVMRALAEAFADWRQQP